MLWFLRAGLGGVASLSRIVIPHCLGKSPLRLSRIFLRPERIGLGRNRLDWGRNDRPRNEAR